MSLFTIFFLILIAFIVISLVFLVVFSIFYYSKLGTVYAKLFSHQTNLNNQLIKLIEQVNFDINDKNNKNILALKALLSLYKSSVIETINNNKELNKQNTSCCKQ